jgi:hypothetical protein
MIRTYLDAGVLISAARGKAPLATKALDILDDPNRQFVSSVFLKLEVLPKAVYHTPPRLSFMRLYLMP